MKDCKETRKTLWPADILRVSDTDVEEALEHAERCSSCRTFLEEDRRVARLVRETVPRVAAPRELRERLYTVLARERAGAVTRRASDRSRHRWIAIAVLAVIGLALGTAGSWLAVHRQPTSPATAFAEDYLRRVVEQDELRSSNRRQIASFFARELGVAMPPPEVPKFDVRRATICLMNGRRGGVVEYEGEGRQLTYYLIPLGTADGSEPRELEAMENENPGATSPALASEHGLGVATWWDGNHQHALVGSLSLEELERLAPLFACPTSRL